MSDILARLCSAVLAEAREISKAGFPDRYRDLFMEQGKHDAGGGSENEGEGHMGKAEVTASSASGFNCYPFTETRKVEGRRER